MTISVIFRRATFSVWTVITGSRLRKIAASVKPTSARPMAEKTMIFRRFLLLGFGIGSSSKTRAVSDLFQIVGPFPDELCSSNTSPGAVKMLNRRLASVPERDRSGSVGMAGEAGSMDILAKTRLLVGTLDLT